MNVKSGNDDKPRHLAASGVRPAPRVKVQDLLQGQLEVILEHDGHDYRLRITASGKLILTK